jgi:hypothetical protein
MREGTELRYVHRDHLGSTSLTTSDNGTVLGSMTYYPYGETRAGSGPRTNSLPAAA